MRNGLRFGIVVLVAIGTLRIAAAQITQITSNPIPAPITKRGLAGRDQGPGAPSGYARDAPS